MNLSEETMHLVKPVLRKAATITKLQFDGVEDLVVNTLASLPKLPILEALEISLKDTASVEYSSEDVMGYEGESDDDGWRRHLLIPVLKLQAPALKKLTLVDCMPNLSDTTNHLLYTNLTHLSLSSFQFKGQGFTIRYLMKALRGMPQSTHLHIIRGLDQNPEEVDAGYHSTTIVMLDKLKELKIGDSPEYACHILK
jgi:hypothetical protein